MKKGKKVTIKSLKRKLDRVFSLYIRQRDHGKCYTCGVKRDIREMDAGHYIKRGHYATRYDERNVHCQCRACNRFKGGMMDEYAVHLLKDYGPNILNELNRLKHTIKKFTIKELQEKIKYYESATKN